MSQVDGSWDVESFTINGYDSTSEFKSHRYYGFYSFTKEKEGRAAFIYNSYGNYGADTSLHYVAAGQWAFDDHKKK